MGFILIQRISHSLEINMRADKTLVYNLCPISPANKNCQLSGITLLSHLCFYQIDIWDIVFNFSHSASAVNKINILKAPFSQIRLISKRNDHDIVSLLRPFDTETIMKMHTFEYAIQRFQNIIIPFSWK